MNNSPLCLHCVFFFARRCIIFDISFERQNRKHFFLLNITEKYVYPVSSSAAFRWATSAKPSSYRNYKPDDALRVAFNKDHPLCSAGAWCTACRYLSDRLADSWIQKPEENRSVRTGRQEATVPLHTHTVHTSPRPWWWCMQGNQQESAMGKSSTRVNI